MLSSIPKPLHEVAGYPMIDHVLNTLFKIEAQDIRVVIGPSMDDLNNHIHKKSDDVSVLLQANRMGTADAVRVGMESQHDDLLVLFADTPFIKDSTIKKMHKLLHADYDENAVVVAGFVAKDPASYGRLMVDSDDILKQIIEFLDCNEEQKKISLCNSGIMLINKKYAKQLLDKINNDNAKKEYYLTDIVKVAQSEGLSCKYIVIDESEAIAVNSRAELAQVEKLTQARLRDYFVGNGVTLLDKDSVYFSIDTLIEKDVVIHPNVVFGPGVEVKSGSEIKPFSHIEKAKIGNDNIIGPFARIRPGTETGLGVKIGNFVEVKNSAIQDESKIQHLSYIGDSYIGKNVNIGAGTITCNYDGYNKNVTKILDGSFVGSNVSLIAPVSIGRGSIIAAGSVITKNVEDDDLAVARVEQRNFINKASYIRRRKNYKRNS